MHKTVLIILAAVVALIVIVVLTGMRYLRADDEDDFDDDIAADRGQSRGRGEHPGREHGRSRHHDDDRSPDGGRQRSRNDRDSPSRGGGRDRADRERSDRAVFAGAGAGRRGSARDDAPDAGRGAARRGDPGRPSASRDGAGRDGAGRDGDRSRASRDGYGRDGASRDGGVRPADRRGPARDNVRDLPGRDTSPRRGGERGWDEAGRDDRRNSGPHRRPAATRDFDVRDSADDLIAASATSGRNPAGRSPRTDDFDDRTLRSPARDFPRGQDGSRSEGGRDAAGTSRDDRARDDRTRDDRERRNNTGPNSRPDSRRTAGGSARREDSLPDVKPRPSKTSQSKPNQSKTKKDDDGDWPSTEWDELSDVDYWAELASDKPLTTTAPAATPPSRPDRDRAEARPEPESGPIPIRAERRESSDRRDRRERDARDTRDRDATERREVSERRDSTERRDSPLLPAARSSRHTVDAAFTPPVVGDPVDQAFGARTESYGTTELRRAIASGRTSTTGPHRIPQPLDDDPLTSPSFPRVDADDSRSYRRSTSRGPGEGQSQTRSHPTYPTVSAPTGPAHPPVGPLDSQPGLSRTGNGYSQSATNGVEYAAAPLADPYLQPSSTAAESRPVQPTTSSYSTPAPALPTASYLPPTGGGYSTDSATSAYSTPMSTSSYSTSTGGYQAIDPPGYQSPVTSQSPAAYLGDHDNGYSAPAPAASGYSLPAVSSYSTAPPPELPDYSGYSGAGQIPAAQPQSTGFSYSQTADPGLPSQLPASQLPSGQSTGSYLSYPPPPTSQAGVYQMPSGGVLPSPSVQPGYPTAPYNAAPYDAPAYPAHSYEADGGGYPADPYAVDPYGYPGYGSARLSDQRWEERSRQEQSWDDRPGTRQYEYPQYWEDDDR